MSEISPRNELVVILHIIEGTGLNWKKTPVEVKATIGGTSLNADIAIPNDAKITFKNKLIWSTDKESIKRMKEENQPIKVECIAIKGENKREPIGFVLIPMLQIPFWNFRKSGMTKSHWHKLINVSNQYKSFKPELLLNVTITEKECAIEETKLDENDLETMKICDETQTIKCINGNIYLGVDDNNTKEVFLISINLKHAEHLECLGNGNANYFDVHYKFAWEKSMPCTKDDINEILPINENVQFKIISTWENLLNYFEKFFFFEIEFFCMDELVGSCALKVNDIIVSLPKYLDEFQRIFNKDEHPFCFHDHLNINSKENDASNFAILAYSFRMDCDKSNNVPALQIASGCSRLSCTTPPQLSSIEILTNRSECSTDNDRTIPRTFSYNLSIIDCTFNRRLNAGVWQFSLQHEKADNPLMIRNIEISDLNVDRICFEDLDLSLSFSTKPNQLFPLIQSKISLLTLKGPKGIHAVAELDNTNLLAHEKNTGIVLLENDRGEQISMAHISVEIIDLGINFNLRDRSRPSPVPTIIDENLAYKAIEELEEWKEFQQQEFLLSLKRTEIETMTRLTNEWNRKRLREEQELKKKIQHCDMLTRNLEQAHKKISILEKAGISHEKSLLRVKNQLENETEKKMSALQNRIRSLEDELRQQKYTENVKLQSMQLKYEQNSIENEKLKYKTKQLENELRDKTECSIPKEEAAGFQANIEILIEKIEELEKSKQTYKERWAKLVREIQKTKFVNQIDDINFSNLNDYLSTDRQELAEDQEELKLIKNSLLKKL